MHACVHIHMYMFAHMHMYTNMCMCVSASVHVCVRVCACMHVLARAALYLRMPVRATVAFEHKVQRARGNTPPGGAEDKAPLHVASNGRALKRDLRRPSPLQRCGSERCTLAASLEEQMVSGRRDVVI